MSEGLLRRSAADVAADPNFERFARAVQNATNIPRAFTRDVVSGTSGTVGDAFEWLFARFPQPVELQVILAEVRRAGADETLLKFSQPGAKLSRSPAVELRSWHTFMDGRVRRNSNRATSRPMQ